MGFVISKFWEPIHTNDQCPLLVFVHTVDSYCAHFSNGDPLSSFYFSKFGHAFTAIFLLLSWYAFLSPANEVWGKVIFLHLSVILFTVGGGVCLSACWDTHPPPGPDPPSPGGVHAVRYGQQAGGTHPTGMHSCIVLIWVIGICVSFNRLQLEKPNPILFFFPFLFSPISFCPLKLAPYVFFTKTERHLKKRIHDKLMVRGGYFGNCLST